jgi:hypothetical protein
MTNRLTDFIEVINHKRAFMTVRNSNKFLQDNISLTRALMHDTIKAINILLLGDNMATKLHRKLAGHHSNKMTYKQKVEAFCDWESARFTKPSKPLNGKQTHKKFYKHINMQDIIKNFYNNQK